MTLPTLILVLTAGLSAMAYPHPLVGRATSTSSPNGSNNNSAFIVAGAVVGTLFLIVAATSIHRMRRARQQASGRATTQTAAQAILSANPSTSNLTNATTPSNTNTGANANRRERRPRRNRRTPSQISTKSLPAYMEQPGDEELVLVQRTTEPEMYSRSSMDLGERSTYESRSSVDVQTPLMQEMHSVDQDEGGDDDESRIPSRQSGHQVNRSIDSIGTSSADTHGSRNSATQLLTSANSTAGDVIDERGEVPPYTEQPAESTVSAPANNPAAGAHRSVASRMMPSMPSGLRHLFSGTRSRPHSHVENSDSSVPMVSVTEAPPINGRQPPSRRTRVDTEVTVPDSGSLPALLLSRSRSPSSGRVALTRPLTNASSTTSLHARFMHQRNRSGSSLSPSVSNAEGSNANPLNSPSSTSISISSPLVHTVTRTEFRFPKSGPTPDQLKFLSSRESLGRFGVPFGEDAERNYPSTLPPPFEATPGASSSRHGSSHSSESTTGTEEAASAPARQRPTSWWRNLTQPAGPHDPPKDVPVLETPDVPAMPASAPESRTALSTSNEVPMGDNEDEFEPATLIPLPPSARQSLAISPSISLSLPPSHDDDDEAEGSRRLSRAGTVSSAHTNVTYQTAADTVHLSSSSSSSSGTETEYYDGDEAVPSTPTMVPQRSLAAVPPLSIHENVDAPSAISAPMPPGTTVAAH